MAAPKGNKLACKRTKYPDECQKAYKSYCDWISQGNSVEAWNYVGKQMTLTYKTIEKYIREFPDEFPPIHKEVALTKSLAIWEERGLKMMLGLIEKSQPAIFQMFMRNKFGWDKENSGQKDATGSLIEEMAKRWRNS